MQNNILRPSLLMGSNNPMKTNENIVKTAPNQNNNIKNINDTTKNINKLKTGRLFILSPAINKGIDMECSINDFEHVKTNYINLGYIGKAVKAKNKKTENLYSIKAIKKEKLIKNGFINTLNKYIHIMYKVDHCFFLRLLSHFEDETNLYLIFQYFNGITLLNKIKSRTLTKEAIFKYFKQIVEALQFLHSKKISFVSLEPESILIDNNDNVRLTDYAYSKISGSESNNREGFKTDNNSYINCYTAPELISLNKGKFHKHRSKGSEQSDLWQIGMLIYEMITGNLLFKCKGESEFYKIMTTPFIKNNDIIKKISQIPYEYKIFTDIIIQLLDFNPLDRISIEKILKIKEIKNISYEKEQIHPSERIINPIFEKDEGTPQEQLINKLKKENKQLKNEINELKAKIEELTTKNEELNKQNINFNKIIYEEPNEDTIKKESELKSQIRKLEVNNQLTKCSLEEEKKTNTALNEKIRELKIDYNTNNFKNSEIIKSLKKKLEDLESKLFNPTNNGYSNQSLQYYLSLFNENINQFTSLIKDQLKINNDISEKAENNLNKFENFLNEKEKVFNDIVNKIFIKMTKDIVVSNSEDLSKKDLNEQNYEDKIIWLVKQTEELIPFKQKYLLLNEEVNKLQTENEILTKNIDHMEKLCKEKEELYDRFIMNNCPNKYDEFKKMH